ncbi:MAG: hypothetical protein ACXQTL_08675 [Methanosarcinales archaeon]
MARLNHEQAHQVLSDLDRLTRMSKDCVERSLKRGEGLTTDDNIIEEVLSTKFEVVQVAKAFVKVLLEDDGSFTTEEDRNCEIVVSIKDCDPIGYFSGDRYTGKQGQ